MSEFDQEEEIQKPTDIPEKATELGDGDDLGVPQEPGEVVAEEYPGQPDELPEEDGRAWYVVHCYSGYENKVRHNLEQRIESMGMKDRIFDVVVPTEEEIEVKEGKRRTVERRVFPGIFWSIWPCRKNRGTWYATPLV